MALWRLLVYNERYNTNDWWGNMSNSRMYTTKHKIAILITMLRDAVGSTYFMMGTELIMTTIISIHTSKISETKEWKITLALLILITLTINVLSLIASHNKNKFTSNLEYRSFAYDIQNRINFKTANELYRVNKKIVDSIRTQKALRDTASSIADFQTLSFYVCNELHNFLCNNLECGEIEVTVFQRCVDSKNRSIARMIAYKNTNNTVPASYAEEFTLSHRQQTSVPLFVKIFNDKNADIKILENKVAVQKEFEFLSNSAVREQKICQYIGIPIRTNRNMVEVLLQIDVTKEKSLGKKYNDIKQFAECVLIPFCNLLHCSYERDLILNKFYDILDENI